MQAPVTDNRTCRQPMSHCCLPVCLTQHTTAHHMQAAQHSARVGATATALHGHQPPPLFRQPSAAHTVTAANRRGMVPIVLRSFSKLLFRTKQAATAGRMSCSMSQLTRLPCLHVVLHRQLQPCRRHYHINYPSKLPHYQRVSTCSAALSTPIYLFCVQSRKQRVFWHAHRCFNVVLLLNKRNSLQISKNTASLAAAHTMLNKDTPTCLGEFQESATSAKAGTTSSKHETNINSHSRVTST
jgi:hypothetical protein